VGHNWCKVKPTVESESKEMVLKVETVLLKLIVGQHVLSIFEAMIEAAVLFYDEVATNASSQIPALYVNINVVDSRAYSGIEEPSAESMSSII